MSSEPQDSEGTLPEISRRQFLETIGKLAGSSAMFKAAAAIGLGSALSGCGSSAAAETNNSGGSTPPPQPPNQPNGYPLPSDWPDGVGNGKSVIILGAGIAGMTSAWEMQKLGYQCTVLEATERAGGRCRTIRSGDIIEEQDSLQVCDFDNDPSLYFNAGPARIPHHHQLLLGYCREFGVALETFVNENRAALFHSSSAFGGQPQTARRIKADSRGYISQLLSTAINQNALDQHLTTSEKSAMLNLLQQFGDLRVDGIYNGSNRAGFDGIENAEGENRGQSLSPTALADLLGSNFWQSYLTFAEDIDQQPTMLQPVGGMDMIAKAFEQRIGELIQFNSQVTQISKNTNGVTINYRDASGNNQTIAADYCICTIPASVLSNINNDFSSNHRQEIATFGYTQACKIAFQSTRFWEVNNSIYGGISWTDQSITQIWYPSTGFGQSQGVIVGAYTFSDQAGLSFAQQSPGQRLTTALGQGDRLHGEYRNELAKGISISWPKMPFQQGAWGRSTPNILLQNDGNVFFAGEHLSILQGWQEGAILSAYRAIDGIVTSAQTEIA